MLLEVTSPSNAQSKGKRWRSVCTPAYCNKSVGNEATLRVWTGVNSTPLEFQLMHDTWLLEILYYILYYTLSNTNLFGVWGGVFFIQNHLQLILLWSLNSFGVWMPHRFQFCGWKNLKSSISRLDVLSKWESSKLSRAAVSHLPVNNVICRIVPTLPDVCWGMAETSAGTPEGHKEVARCINSLLNLWWTEKTNVFYRAVSFFWKVKSLETVYHQ